MNHGIIKTADGWQLYRYDEPGRKRYDGKTAEPKNRLRVPLSTYRSQKAAEKALEAAVQGIVPQPGRTVGRTQKGKHLGG